MKFPREQVYQGFFDLLNGKVDGVKTYTRRADLFTNFAPADQPALVVEQIGENPIKVFRGVPYKWELDIMIMVYVYVADTSIAPASVLNPIVDSIEQILSPQAIPGPGQNLGQAINSLGQIFGGIVEEVRLLGDGKSSSGQRGPQASAFIPVRITST